jgi:hypothetical protein
MDARQVRISQFDRRNLPGPDAFGHVNERAINNIVHFDLSLIS